MKQMGGPEYESEDSAEEISDDEVNEFWHIEGRELNQKRALAKEREQTVMFAGDSEKMMMDKKLEEYLSIHSTNLSVNVRAYIEKAKKGTMTEEE